VSMLDVATAPPPALASGTLIGSYRLRERIGFGGMGEVYAAVDTRLQTSSAVAVKVLFDSSADPSTFEREIGILRTVEHSNVVRLFDFGEWRGRFYLVMELLTGQDLRALLRQRGGPLSWEETRWIAVETCSALGAIHDKGVVHRDVKPQNLFLIETDRGVRLKLLDFGIARYTSSELGMTTTGTRFIGTAAYASPEQIRGDALSPRTDIYALGCVLYELLTGQPPFVRATPEAVLVAHASERPEPPSLLRPSIARRVDRLVLKALEKDPRRRFGTAGALSQDAIVTKSWDAPRIVWGVVLGGLLVVLMSQPFVRKSQGDSKKPDVLAAVAPVLPETGSTDPPSNPPASPPNLPTQPTPGDAPSPPNTATEAVPAIPQPAEERPRRRHTAKSTSPPPSTAEEGAVGGAPLDFTVLSHRSNKAINDCTTEGRVSNASAQIVVTTDDSGTIQTKLAAQAGTFSSCVGEKLRGQTVLGLKGSFDLTIAANPASTIISIIGTDEK
jgi:serine/threonine protein kinase